MALNVCVSNNVLKLFIFLALVETSQKADEEDQKNTPKLTGPDEAYSKVVLNLITNIGIPEDEELNQAISIVPKDNLKELFDFVSKKEGINCLQ